MCIINNLIDFKISAYLFEVKLNYLLNTIKNNYSIFITS